MARLTATGGVSKLAEQCAAGATTLKVESDDGMLFPAAGDFLLRIESGSGFEIVRATARSGDTITINRGQDGTTAMTHPVGADVWCVISHTYLAEMWGAIGGGLGPTAMVVASDAPVADRAMATSLKATYGDRVQLCTGTADQVKINAALDAINAIGGGSVVLSAGNFFLSASIELPQTGGYSHVTVMGQGQGTILKVDTAGGGLADHFVKCKTEAARHLYVTLRDFQINGQAQAANGNSDSSGVKLWAGTYSRVYDVTVQNCYKHGLWLASGEAPDLDSVDFVVQNCKLAANGGDGLLFDATTTDITVEGCNIYYNQGIGIHFKGGGCIAMANRIYENVGDNIKSNGMWTQIVGNNISGDYRGIELGPNAHNTIIQGNICQYHNQQDIYIDDNAQNITIVGNWFNSPLQSWTRRVEGGLQRAMVIRDNTGYLGPGEVREYSLTISEKTQDSYNSVDNPFGRTVLVLEHILVVETAHSGGSPVIDVGIGSSATADYTTLHDDVPCTTQGAYSSVNTPTTGKQTSPQVWMHGSGNRYLNHSIKGAAAGGMTARWYVRVMGQ